MTKKPAGKKGMEVNPPEIKKLIRKRIARGLRATGKKKSDEKSRKVMERLFSLPEFASSTTILFYASKEGEVNTHEAISKSIEMGKKVIVPIVSGDKLLLSYISDIKGLSKGAYGIPEPIKKKIIPAKPNEVELAIIPGIAFDKTGNRLGRGNGYFDRFLRLLNAPIIGLAFDFQIVGSIPSEKHDVPVNKIVTEKRVISTV